MVKSKTLWAELAMQFRTWPYGTIKQVEVLMRDRARINGAAAVILTVGDDQKEAYILIGTEREYPEGQPGDKGEITFCEGGPTGGHWKFKKT